MKKDIDEYYFSTNVFWDDIYCVVLNYLKFYNSIKITDNFRREVYELENSLQRKIINENLFINHLNNSISAKYNNYNNIINEEDLLDSIKVNLDALSVAGDLRERNYSVVLYTSYPQKWFEIINNRTSIAQNFDRVLFIESPYNILEYHDYLINTSVVKSGKSLFVDKNPFCIKNLIRKKIDAIIYVDEKRLRRELKLRLLL